MERLGANDRNKPFRNLLFIALQHPNVVEYYGFIETEDNFYIVMECVFLATLNLQTSRVTDWTLTNQMLAFPRFCENGSLQSLLRKFGGSFPESLVSVYLRQVLEGLDFLHEQGVVHRDIKGNKVGQEDDDKVNVLTGIYFQAATFLRQRTVWRNWQILDSPCTFRTLPTLPLEVHLTGVGGWGD